MIEVSRFKDLNAAELFLGFRIGSVRRGDLAVFPVQRHCSLRRLKRHFGQKVSVAAEMLVMGKALVKHSIALALRHVLELASFEISQTDVFHDSFPRCCVMLSFFPAPA